jgi:PKD repeat protein
MEFGMNMKTKKRSRLILSVFVMGVLLLVAPALIAEETLIKIIEEGNFAYFKPEVKIAPNGDIYVAYQAQNLSSGRSEIYLSKYSNGTAFFVKNVSDSSAHSYEPELDIRGNGDVHVAWCDETGDTQSIKHRYYNGSSWSGITTFGQVENSDEVEDLRIAVDESGNVFVVFMHWQAAKCVFISMYGNNVTFESFPESGRSKHPDVAVDANYVHIVWQYKPGSDYVIAYQRRPNSRNSNWDKWVDVKGTGPFGVQRPRMALDSSGTPHVVFFSKGGDAIRQMQYKKWNGSSFSDFRIMSDPNQYLTYHFCEIVAVNGDNVLGTVQRGGIAAGKNISYNWKKNGKWSGLGFFEKSSGPRPTKHSADLAKDKLFAAIVFADRDDAVYLILVDEGGNVGGGGDAPVANFTFSPQDGHAPLAVTFDGSNSSDPDGEVVGYRWDFGDGNSGSGQIVEHTFLNQGQYTIRLTVTDNDGETGSTTHLIVVDRPNDPPVAHFTFSPASGLYPLTVNFDASGSNDSDGSIEQYEWDFGGEQTGSGRTITHTFNDEGIHIITLTVYDDDGASSTATGTVEVLGLLSPLNIIFEAKVNRNLFTIQHVYQITWDRNSGNANRGANIVQYNIYRKMSGDFQYDYVATVVAQDHNEYYDRLDTATDNYVYTVTAVDDQGRESNIGAPTSRMHANYWPPLPAPPQKPNSKID